MKSDFALILFLASALISAKNASAIPISTPQPIASPTTAPLLNRTILTVEGRTYSLFDVEILLLLWNTANPESPTPLTTHWEEMGGFLFDRKKSFLRNYEKWPVDVRRLLFITLNWPELSDASSFSTTKEQREELFQKCRTNPQLAQMSPSTQRYIAAAEPGGLLELADMVLHARKSERLRGAMRESTGGLRWFWHQRLGERATSP